MVTTALEDGISLGKNPKRTIRYYISKGLIDPPNLEYAGKVKHAIYSEECLTKLKLINIYKKKGYSLDTIKTKMGEPAYWSDDAIRFIHSFKITHNYPDDAFQKDKPIVTPEFCAFLYCLEEAVKNKALSQDEQRNLIKISAVDKEGNTFLPIEMFSV